MYSVRVSLARQVSPQQFLQLIADPRRWRLVGELARSDRRVGELTQLVGEPQNLVSYHLRELRDAGLVSSRRSSFDGRDAYYRVDLARCRDLLCAAGAARAPIPTPHPGPQRRKPPQDAARERRAGDGRSWDRHLPADRQASPPLR